ncbi:MAG: lanthionine synthetase LanC family protein [Bacteroidota bacterium]
MAYGAGGIGFVFNQLAQYFEYTPFERIAQAAFQYENDHFDNELSNWPDWRKNETSDLTKQVLESSYLADKKSYFKENKNSMTWASGAPGVGFSRLYSSDKRSLSDVELALNITYEMLNGSKKCSLLTLGDGHLGNIIFLSRAQKMLDKKTHDQFIFESVENILVSNSLKHNRSTLDREVKRSKNIGLFEGYSGLGYFYLSLIDAPTISSILSPTIQGTFKGNSNEFFKSILSIKSTLLLKSFPKTYRNLKEKHHQKPEDFIHERTDFHNIFNAFHQRILKKPIIKNDHNLLDTYCLEKKCLELDSDIWSLSYVNTRQEVELKKSLQLIDTIDESNWNTIWLSLMEDARVIDSGRDCDFQKQINKMYGKGRNKNPILLMPGAKSTMQLTLDPFMQFLVEKLRKGTDLKTLMEATFEKFSKEQKSELKDLKIFTIDALKNITKLGAIRWDSKFDSKKKVVESELSRFDFK